MARDLSLKEQKQRLPLRPFILPFMLIHVRYIDLINLTHFNSIQCLGIWLL